MRGRLLKRQTAWLRAGARGNWRRRWREMKWDRENQGSVGEEEGEWQDRGEWGGVYVGAGSKWRICHTSAEKKERSSRENSGGCLWIKHSFGLLLSIGQKKTTLIHFSFSVFLHLIYFFVLDSSQFAFPSSPLSLLVCPPYRHVYNPGDSNRCWWPDVREQCQASVHTGAGPAVLLCWSPDRWVWAFSSQHAQAEKCKKNPGRCWRVVHSRSDPVELQIYSRRANKFNCLSGCVCADTCVWLERGHGDTSRCAFNQRGNT